MSLLSHSTDRGRPGTALAHFKQWSVRTAVVLGVSLCAMSVNAQAAKTLVFGHGAAPGNPRSLAAERMAKLVKKYSNGDIELRIQGSEQLGSDVQMLQQVQSGAIGVTANSQGPLASIVPKANAFGLPFLFNTPQAAWPVVDGPIGDEVATQAQKRGLKVLAWWGNGLRQITNNIRPISEPSDMKGLKIRTPKDAVTIATMKALGANPTPLAFGELYQALKQGTVDGQENPIVNIVSSHLNEVQKYLSLANYRYEVTPVVMGMSTWKSLSKQDQQALQKAAQQAGDFERHTLVSQNRKLLEKLRQGNNIKINQVDTRAFRKATRSVDEEWQNKLGDIVKRIQKAAAKANREHADKSSAD